MISAATPVCRSTCPRTSRVLRSPGGYGGGAGSVKSANGALQPAHRGWRAHRAPSRLRTGSGAGRDVDVRAEEVAGVIPALEVNQSRQGGIGLCVSGETQVDSKAIMKGVRRPKAVSASRTRATGPLGLGIHGRFGRWSRRREAAQGVEQRVAQHFDVGRLPILQQLSQEEGVEGLPLLTVASTSP